MRNRESVLDSMEYAAADHELLAAYIECFHRMFAHPSPRVARKAADATKLFLNRKIPDHFAYEERHIFPALLKVNHGRKLAHRVAELRDEHRQLLKEARRLTALLSDEAAAYNRPRLLRQAMQRFFHNIEKHAGKENDLFPSLL